MQAQKLTSARPREQISYQNNTRLHTQEKPFTAKRKAAVYAIIILCVILSVLVITFYSKVVTTQYQISETEAKIEALMQEQQDLELKVARLNCLERIEGIARTQLGMIEERELEIQTVSHEEIAGSQ